MKRGNLPRYVILASLLASLLPLTACSYIANFVVVNASDRDIQVRYKSKSLHPTFVLGVKEVSQVGQEVPWQDLSASEVAFDPDTLTVTVSLKPGEALRIDSVLDDDEVQRAAMFSIVEIDIKSASGEMKLQGDQLYKSFVAGRNDFYILTYK
jgi:hypothetical protein